MSAPTSHLDQPTTERKRHPIGAFFASIPLALGVVGILLVTTVIELALAPMITVAVIVLVLGTAWGLFGPSSGPKGPPPIPSTRTDPTAPRPPPAAGDDLPPPPPVDAGGAETSGDAGVAEGSDGAGETGGDGD